MLNHVWRCRHDGPDDQAGFRLRNHFADVSRTVHKTGSEDEATSKRYSMKDVPDGMPKSHRAYIPVRPLGHEYRRVYVGGYAMFYWIDEPEKMVTVVRVVYARRDT